MVESILLTIYMYVIGFTAVHEVSSLAQEGIEQAMNAALKAAMSPVNAKQKKRFNLFRKK